MKLRNNETTETQGHQNFRGLAFNLRSRVKIEEKYFTIKIKIILLFWLTTP